MKMNYSLSKTAFLLFLQIFVCSSALTENMNPGFVLRLPKETAVLKLPQNELKWKEIVRVMSDDYCLVERIPAHQDAKQWSERIGIQIYSENGINEKTISIDTVAETIKNDAFNRDPDPRIRVIWNQVRKNPSELIYELIMHSSFEGIPIVHEITRVFLTKYGIHHIGFTRRYEVMSKAERAKWIEILEKDVSLESSGHAFEMEQTISFW